MREDLKVDRICHEWDDAEWVKEPVEPGKKEREPHDELFPWCDEREAESEVTMQVDSPCHSPASLTPATSLSQLASADNVPTPDQSSTSPAGPEDMESTTSQDAMEVECDDSQMTAMQKTLTKYCH